MPGAPSVYRPVQAVMMAPGAYRPAAAAALQPKKLTAGFPLPSPRLTGEVSRQGMSNPAAKTPVRAANYAPAPQALKNPSSAVLQRKLQATSENERVREYLQKLVGGSSTVTVAVDGTVSLVTDDTKKDNSPGVTLLNRLIESARTVSISPHDLDSGAKNRPDSKDDATNGVGTGSTVSLGPGSQMSLVKNELGELVEEATPSWLILGHELIHADRAARGMKRKGIRSYSVTGKWENKSLPRGFEHVARREETETVGLSQGNDITENGIRAYHKMHPVAMYESDHRTVIDGIFEKQSMARKLRAAAMFGGPSSPGSPGVKRAVLSNESPI